MSWRLEQGLFASLTPLRDVAGLADNLPLLVIASILVFRASFEIPGWGVRAPGTGTLNGSQAQTRAGWLTLVWGCGSLYALYRVVARMAGSTDLPLGSCLVVEGLVVPLLMVICDGFLLAWLLVELRNAGFDDDGRGSPRRQASDRVSCLRQCSYAPLRCRLGTSRLWYCWLRRTCPRRPTPHLWAITFAGNSAGD